jgi:TNF receptor-associated protein 1
VVKFLQDQLKKKPEEYEKFYNDYGLFIKEGIITNPIQSEKEDAGKLLLFESSHKNQGEKMTLDNYIERAKDSKTIFYLAAPR